MFCIDSPLPYASFLFIPFLRNSFFIIPFLVLQHVLQHGNPEERSTIITQLAGQIVKMSQQKFASNVVEKCLTFGNPEQRQILINEMLGTTDENEPLQVCFEQLD